MKAVKTEILSGPSIWTSAVSTLIGTMLSASVLAGDLTDSKVFDWRFYLNAHGDLIAAGLSTEAQAQAHWLNSGITEGRQGHPAFHSKQYLDNYSDLQVFGTNWLAAVNHYLDNGFNEGRKGFTLPGNGRNINYFSRLTVSSNDAVPYAEKIFVSGSTRTAGAIDSLYWHGKEFINSYDHGRQLQIAVADARYGECLNPTEAGGRTDGVGTNTSALNQSGELLGLNSLYTVTRPAYWLRPGESGAACGSISTAVNTANTSPSVFSKNILVGAAGFSNVIGFNALISYNESFPLGDQIEGPTGYIAPDVNFFYTFDLTNPLSQLTALSIASNCDTSDATVAALVRALNGCKISTPVIASTQDGSHAMGIYNPHLHSADPSVRKNGNYEFYFVDSKVNSFSGAPAESNQFKATAKWATRIVENNRNIYGGCSTEFNVYIVIGTKDVVYATMRQLYSNQMSGLLPNPVSNGTQCP